MDSKVQIGQPSCSKNYTNVMCKNVNPLETINDSPESSSSDEVIDDEGAAQTNILNVSSENADNFNIPDMPESYLETYQKYINKVKALASVPIEERVTPEYLNNFKHFNLRYYEDKYCINFINAETGYNDILIRIHTNKLVLIALASGNDIIRHGKDITGINFIINNIDRSNVKVGGKKKKGAKCIEKHTILCQVKCEGLSKMFNIRAGIPGRIIEINELVKENPNLLKTDPKGCGYVAIIAPKGHPSEYEKMLDKLKLLNEEKYIQYLSERPPTFSDSSVQTILKYTS